MDQDYVDKQIDAKIIEINNNDNIYEIGTVVNVRDFIIEVTGINNVMFYEKINIANKALGYVNSINESTVTVAVLRIDAPINVGDMVYSTNTLYTGSYSNSSFGRVIDLFGNDKLSGKKYSDLIDIPIERKTIPIMDRGTVNRPLLTGITGIDLMYPIGRGQRQLIIGDKRTGKTQIGLDTIVNQKGQNVLCFYVAIGKTKKEVKNIYSELMKKGALEYTTIITAFNDELPPVISLIPYFALSVAENYMMDGYDVLVVIDDLKRHAEAYREISLISGKTPGRDAYPADIFYTHSRLLEKGCQHKNGGSITILPIVETKGGDITDYISTNIISITDGQIVLSDKAFQKGEKPAINYGLSVSRLGGAVQEQSMKAVGSVVRRKLLSYLETRSVYELVNMDEMSTELKNQFMEGKIILGNMMQYKFSPKTPQEMMDMFSGIVEVDNTPKEENKDEKYLSSNNEDSVFDRNNQPVSTDVFENNEEKFVDSEQTEVASIEVPTDVPVEVTAPLEAEVPTDVPVENPVGEGFEVPAPVEATVVPEESAVDAPVEEAAPVETEVPTEAPVENPVGEGFEVPAPVEATVVPEEAAVDVPVEEAAPVEAEVPVENPVGEGFEVPAPIEATVVPEEPVIEASVEVPAEEATPNNDVVIPEGAFEIPAVVESTDEVPQVVAKEPVIEMTEPVCEDIFNNNENTDEPIFKVSDNNEEDEVVKEHNNVSLDDSNNFYGNIEQDVRIDNPQTEEDESIEPSNTDLNNVAISYDFDNNNPTDDIYEEPSDSYVTDVNDNNSFDPSNISLNVEDEDVYDEPAFEITPEEDNNSFNPLDINIHLDDESSNEVPEEDDPFVDEGVEESDNNEEEVI